MTTKEKFQQITNEIVELLDKKNKDYGDANLTIMGLYGISVRLCDKVMRLANLSLRDNQAVEESIEDTLKDIAGYAINALRLIKEKKLSKRGVLDVDSSA